MATINNKFEKAPVTNEQWHKMWLADDMPAYKRAVAAVSFAPKILQSQEVEKKEEQVAETENMDNTQAKKYRLDETDRIDFYDHTLYRIIALKDFSDVKAGDKGGYVESEDNLFPTMVMPGYMTKPMLLVMPRLGIMRKYLVILKFMAIPKLLGMLEYLVMVN